MGDRSPMSPGGERYSPQRSYTQSRSRSPDGRGRCYTPDRDDKVASMDNSPGRRPHDSATMAFCAPAPRMHVDQLSW